MEEIVDEILFKEEGVIAIFTLKEGCYYYPKRKLKEWEKKIFSRNIYYQKNKMGRIFCPVCSRDFIHSFVKRKKDGKRVYRVSAHKIESGSYCPGSGHEIKIT